MSLFPGELSMTSAPLLKLQLPCSRFADSPLICNFFPVYFAVSGFPDVIVKTTFYFSLRIKVQVWYYKLQTGITRPYAFQRISPTLLCFGSCTAIPGLKLCYTRWTVFQAGRRQTAWTYPLLLSCTYNCFSFRKLNWREITWSSWCTTYIFKNPPTPTPIFSV